MTKKTTEFLKVLAFIVLGIFLAWLSIRNLPMEKFMENIYSVNIFWGIPALAIGLLSHVIRALRWNMLLEPAGYRIKPLNAFMAVMSGYLINLALPRTGEIARCGLASRYDKVPMNVGVGTVVAERAVDMIILLILFGLNFLLGYQRLRDYIADNFWHPVSQKLTPPVLVFLGVGAIVFFAAAFWYLRRKRKNKPAGQKGLLEGFVDGLKSVIELKRPILFILISLSIWLCYFLMLQVAFWAFPATEDLGPAACLSVFVFGTIGMIVTPGGIGAYPALVGQTLMLYGIEDSAGISFGWIVWGAQTALFLILGPLSLIGFPIFNAQNKDAHDAGTDAE